MRTTPDNSEVIIFGKQLKNLGINIRVLQFQFSTQLFIGYYQKNS